MFNLCKLDGKFCWSPCIDLIAIALVLLLIVAPVAMKLHDSLVPAPRARMEANARRCVSMATSQVGAIDCVVRFMGRLEHVNHIAHAATIADTFVRSALVRRDLRDDDRWFWRYIAVVEKAEYYSGYSTESRAILAKLQGDIFTAAGEPELAHAQYVRAEGTGETMRDFRL